MANKVVGAGPDTVVPEDFDLEQEMETGIVIRLSYAAGNTIYHFSAEGKHISIHDSMEDALSVVKKWMDNKSLWLNIFYVNDHGNVSLIDSEGNEHGSWV